MSTRTFLRFAVVIAALAGAGFAVVKAVGGPEQTTARYRTEAATTGSIEAAVLATGTLAPVVTVQVGSQISGQIIALEADFNSAVTKDQVIARLDPASYRGKLDQAEADLAVAEATITAKQAALAATEVDLRTAHNALADAEQTHERTRRLSTAGHATERQLQLDTFSRAQAQEAIGKVEAQIRMAEADLAVARAQVEQKRAAVAIARTDLDRTIIRSPETGVVVNRQIDIGQTVAASLQAPILFEIARDLREMRLEASVDEADIGRVAPGQAVSFTVDAFPDRTFSGVVEQIRKAPTVVSNVTTYTVVVATANPDMDLLPGMTASVRIVESRRDDVVKVPAAALRFRPEGARRTPSESAGAGNADAGKAETRKAPTSAVYVLGAGGEAVRRPVETGLVSDGFVEITSGVETGEAVIVGADGADGKPRRPRSMFGF
jgi:HlyD family secretion protein